MADESKEEVTLTVLDEIDQDETATEETAMEVDGDKDKEKSKTEEKEKPKIVKRKPSKRWGEDDVEDSDDLESEDEEETEEDPEKEEEARLNPRYSVIVHPLIFRDFCNIKEIRAVLRQADHYEVAYYRLGKPKAEKPFRSKRGYARLSFRNPEVAYWVVDNLRNMKVDRRKTSGLQCAMTNREMANDFMHPEDFKHSTLRIKLQEIKEKDISLQALYFGHLPKNATVEKLKEYIPEAKEVFMPLFKGQTRGYAYVEFESPEQTEEALKTYKTKKLDNTTVIVRKVGSGKIAHFVDFKDSTRRISSNGRIGRPLRGGRTTLRPRSPPRGRRYEGPIWESFGRDGDRKRRFMGAGPVRMDPYRRERMDDLERGLRREYRERMFDDMRLRGELSRGYVSRGYDRGFGGDPWLSSSAFRSSY